MLKIKTRNSLENLYELYIGPLQESNYMRLCITNLQKMTNEYNMHGYLGWHAL